MHKYLWANLNKNLTWDKSLQRFHYILKDLYESYKCAFLLSFASPFGCACSCHINIHTSITFLALDSKARNSWYTIPAFKGNIVFAANFSHQNANFLKTPIFPKLLPRCSLHLSHTGWWDLALGKNKKWIPFFSVNGTRAWRVILHMRDQDVKGRTQLTGWLPIYTSTPNIPQPKLKTDPIKNFKMLDALSKPY